MLQRILQSIRATILASIVFLSSFSAANAQCDQNNITLYSQAAVNGFRHNYHCTKVTGTLDIRGDVYNLDSLDQITEVGTLWILSTKLTNLKGLSSLTKVGGFWIAYDSLLTSMQGIETLSEVMYMTIQNNSSLSSLIGFNNLHVVRGNLMIEDNNSLLSLNGLNALDSVRDELRLQKNIMLQNLTGLDNLSKAGYINVQQNDALYSFQGLGNLSALPLGFYALLNLNLTTMGSWDKLKHVGRVFEIYACPKLQSLSGLHLEDVTDTIDYGGFNIQFTGIKDMTGMENLDHITGRCYIGYNDSLKTLHGLENLKFVNGPLGIEDNHVLTTIDAIANIEHNEGELEISSNYVLSACAVPFVCKYLAAPPGLVLVFDNADGCKSPEEVKANCSPIVEFNLIEANLEVDDSAATTGDIRLLTPMKLAGLTKKRAAVATDGVSTILVRIATEGKGYLDIDPPIDGIELPWGDSTYFVNGKYYVFLLYTPPDEFDDTQDVFLYGDEVEAYNIPFAYAFDTGTSVRENHFSITHVRPPVVLMHGTYSDPVTAWRTQGTGEVSMYNRLINAGFKVFTVNYKETNGTTGLGIDNTSFQANAKVLWGDVYPQNTGGIKDALSYYRHTLGIASTQADVVGHSLGGILPRVYASSHYNPDYKRAENFMEGDINRLITLGSTHFGSHLGELQIFLNGISPFDIGALDWLALQGVNLISSWVGGSSPSSAVVDQLPPPMGTSLGLIGRTDIPSHAITFSVPKGALKDPQFDPDESYYDMYWYITTLLYQIMDVRTHYLDSKVAMAEGGMLADSILHGGDPGLLYKAYTKTMLFKTMIEDAIQKAGVVTSVLDGTFEIPSHEKIFKYALGETSMGSLADPLIDIFVSGSDPVGVVSNYFFNVALPTPQSIIADQLKVREGTIEGLRSLIFDNDDNDGVVRVQSQSGELEKECPACVTHFDKVLHGFGPRYPAVQDRVINLLKGNMDEFAPNGFPSPDHAQKLYYPPESLDLIKVPVSGGEAICQSGMVPAHARAFAHIADETNTIIIMRPVNADATDLIAGNVATKDMDVKAKTANWGPQKGYLPVEQRYSKLWNIYEGEKRKQIIHYYDSLAQENLTLGITVARQLKVKVCNGVYNIYIDKARFTGPDDGKAEDEVVMVPVDDPSKVCHWGSEFLPSQIIMDCEDLGPQHLLMPMLVMASPQQLEDDGTTHRFLTADYDILMTGFQRGPDLGAPMPPVVPFKPKVGQITEQQELLVAELNTAVDGTGYLAGQVVHHGPENQYDKSPYIDYPLTVFAPDNIPNGLFNTSTDGLILSIEMGPPGFRDINLKQFVNRMRREGYDLYQNALAPGWKWMWSTDAESFKLEDDKNLGDYVEQHPANVCSKFGGQESVPCPVLPPSTDTNNEKKDKGIKGRSPHAGLVKFSVVPSLVYDENISLNSDIESEKGYTWMIIDTFGNIKEKGTVQGNSEYNTTLLNVTNLQPGLYTVVTDAYGQAGRFVKM